MRQHLQKLIADTPKLNLCLVLMSVLPVTRGIVLDLFALRVLRYGAHRSMQSFLWMSLFPMIMLGLGQYYFALFSWAFSIVPIMVFSTVLSRCNQWQKPVEGLMLVLIVLCYVTQFIIPVAWSNFLTIPFIQQWQTLSEQWFPGQTLLSVEQIKQILPAFMCVYIFSNVIHVFVARALQSWCFNPGGFKQELRAFSLSWITPMIMTLGVVGVLYGNSFAMLGIMLAMLPLALLGFMKLFTSFERLRLKTWQLPLLAIAVVALLPYALALFVLTGFVDTILKYLGVSYATYIARKSS